MPISSHHFISYYRHSLPVRIMHWVNVIAVLALLMSGLQIFNAHPALYWGKSSYTGKPPILTMQAYEKEDGRLVGITSVYGRDFDTTGVLGVSALRNGDVVARGFPAWITLPDSQWLARGRHWHLFFAWLFLLNGVAYVGYSIFSKHLTRDLLPTKADWRGIVQSVIDHILFRHPRGDAEKRYNVLQKIAYLAIIFIVLPLIALTGWSMSPTLDSLLTGWVNVFGGRQSARTIHFIAAWALVGFVLIHVFEVVVSGLWNQLRSMITGRYRIRGEGADNADQR